MTDEMTPESREALLTFVRTAAEKQRLVRGNRTTDELKTIVRDALSDKIFFDRMIGPHEGPEMLRMIFLPLVFVGPTDHSESEWPVKWSDLPDDLRAEYYNVMFADVGGFFEYYDKAGPPSINGYPCFFSVHVLSVQDAERVYAAIARERAKGPPDIDV